MKRLTQIAGALVIAAAVSPGAAAVSATPPASALLGSWAGIFSDGTRSLYATLTIEANPNGSIAATVSYPMESEDVFAVRTALSDDGRLHLETTTNNETLTVDGSLSGDRITGRYNYGSAQGSLELWPLRKRPRADLRPYTGDFSDGHGRDVVVSESLGVLYFLDLASGRTGRLFPLSNDEFFGGPTRLIYAPVRVTAAFTDRTRSFFEALRLTIDGASSLLHRTTVGDLVDVSFAAPGARIAGTLRRPRGAGPFPAVLLLAGSNAQPRGGYFSIEDFVADHFLRLGFVVLTFDKRGAGDSTGAVGDNGVEFVAAAAFRFLKSQPNVDPGRIGIWGMSQGGIIAPKVAILEPGVRFIINVSGSIVDANTEEVERTASMMKVDGFSEPDIAAAVAFQRLKFHYAMTGQGWSEYLAAYRHYQNAAWFPDPYVGPPDSKRSSAWKFWRESGAMHPVDYWRTFTQPVLLIYGRHDTIGDPDENAALFALAMKDAGNKGYTTTILAEADHSMYVSHTGSWHEERLITTFDLNFFETLDWWLRSRRFN